MGRDEAKLAKVTTRSLKALQLYSQAEPRVLYAGTYLGGVFKSGNAGGGWTPMNTGLTSSYVPVLAIYLSAPTTLYAATSSGVFKSVNGDGSWTAVNTGLLNTNVSALAIDPSASATLYAGTRVFSRAGMAVEVGPR